MHKITKHRLIKFIIISLMIVTGVLIILINLRDNIVFFYTPTDLQTNNYKHKIRVGGLVKSGSINQENKNTQVIHIFILSDDKADITVKFAGSLPLLFRENQGIVAEGYLKDKYFLAEKILAKHDERYMPKDLADKITNGSFN